MGGIIGVFEPRYCGDTRAAQLFDEVERLKEKLAQTVRERDAALALATWQPITESNLPKYGDEVMRRSVTGDKRRHFLAGQMEMSFETLRDYGYTHFRPINAPAAQERP